MDRETCPLDRETCPLDRETCPLEPRIDRDVARISLKVPFNEGGMRHLTDAEQVDEGPFTHRPSTRAACAS